MDWGLFLLVVAAGALVATGAGLLVRGAGAPISLWLAAVVAGAGAAVAAWRWQAGFWPGWWLPVTWLVTVLGVPLALADARHRRLPDVLTLPAYPLLAAALAGGGLETLTAALTGTIVFGGAHLLVRHLAPTQLGPGDVKLTGSLGAVLGAVGWPALAFAAVAASALTAALAAAGHLGAVARRLGQNIAHQSQPSAALATDSAGGAARASTRRLGKSAAHQPEPNRGPARPTTPPTAANAVAEPPSAAAVVEPSSTAVDERQPATVPRRTATDSSRPAAHPRAAAPQHRPPQHSRHPQPLRLPHGPPLLLATWLCAVFGGPGSGVAMS